MTTDIRLSSRTVSQGGGRRGPAETVGSGPDPYAATPQHPQTQLRGDPISAGGNPLRSVSAHRGGQRDDSRYDPPVTARRALFVLGWLLCGLAALAGVLGQAHQRGPKAWVMSLAVAAISLGAFAVTLRPRLLRASPVPASQNARLSWLAAGAVLVGMFSANALPGVVTAAVVSVGFGAVLGLLLWTPTLGVKRAEGGGGP